MIRQWRNILYFFNYQTNESGITELGHEWVRLAENWTGPEFFRSDFSVYWYVNYLTVTLSPQQHMPAVTMTSFFRRCRFLPVQVRRSNICYCRVTFSTSYWHLNYYNIQGFIMYLCMSRNDSKTTGLIGLNGLATFFYNFCHGPQKKKSGERKFRIALASIYRNSDQWAY